jgi:hypothetical protein
VKPKDMHTMPALLTPCAWWSESLSPCWYTWDGVSCVYFLCRTILNRWQNSFRLYYNTGSKINITVTLSGHIATEMYELLWEGCGD